MTLPNHPIPSITLGIETAPAAPPSAARNGGDSHVELVFDNPAGIAAKALAEHLFAHTDKQIAGLSYAVKYKLAEGQVGGDLVDVYQFDNDSIAISVADIAGKGTQAAVHAAMIKYGLRAYASLGLSPERVLRSLDRLYLENNSFERSDSFASVFFGQLDPTRRLFHYASAAHEPVLVVQPGKPPEVLPTTAPLLGVFDDQHHLFRQKFVNLEPEALLVMTTDGVTESRNPDGEQFGMDRFVRIVDRCRDLNESEIVDAILQATEEHCQAKRRDDIALVALRVC